MTREIIQTVRTPLYDKSGRLRVYQVDTYFVERPETPPPAPRLPAPRPPALGPPSPKPTTVAPPPPVVTMTVQELGKAMVEGTMVGVPPPPETLSEALRMQHERGVHQEPLAQGEPS